MRHVECRGPNRHKGEVQSRRNQAFKRREQTTKINRSRLVFVLSSDKRFASWTGNGATSQGRCEGEERTGGGTGRGGEVAEQFHTRKRAGTKKKGKAEMEMRARNRPHLGTTRQLTLLLNSSHVRDTVRGEQKGDVKGAGLGGERRRGRRVVLNQRKSARVGVERALLLSLVFLSSFIGLGVRKPKREQNMQWRWWPACARVHPRGVCVCVRAYVRVQPRFGGVRTKGRMRGEGEIKEGGAEGQTALAYGFYSSSSTSHEPRKQRKGEGRSGQTGAGVTEKE